MKNLQKNFFTIISLFLLAVIHIGSPASAKDLVIMTSLPSMEFPFFVHMQKQLDQEARRIGGIKIMAADGQNRVPKQTADVESAIIQGVDGIIISPIDVNAMAPALQQAIDAGIPVVTVDRYVGGVPDIYAHVGADNVKGGEAQARLIMEMFPSGATIVNLQGQPGASPAIDRNKGLHNILDGNSKYKIVSEQTANWSRDQGMSVTENILTGLSSPPDVINAANDDMALGAMEAVKARGLNVKILGFDALPEAIAAVRDGSLMATVEQFPGGQSKTALNLLVNDLRSSTKPYNRVIFLNPITITSDNYKQNAERIGEVK
jgi:ABC-type sugar transport system substrate-binding protein